MEAVTKAWPIKQRVMLHAMMGRMSHSIIALSESDYQLNKYDTFAYDAIAGWRDGVSHQELRNLLYVADSSLEEFLQRSTCNMVDAAEGLPNLKACSDMTTRGYFLTLAALVLRQLPDVPDSEADYFLASIDVDREGQTFTSELIDALNQELVRRAMDTMADILLEDPEMQKKYVEFEQTMIKLSEEENLEDNDPDYTKK